MKKLIYTLFICFIAFSCSEEPKTNNNSGENESEPKEVVYTKENLKELKTAAKVANYLPSPVEMAHILHETNTVYDEEILNAPRNIDNYITDAKRALNLGVYFADLSFTSMFDYPQQAMKFMGAAQALSDELNIVGIFTEEMTEKLEMNMGNKDSLMDIVASTYIETDLYLQDNDRPVVAKSIIGGAWIEGLYIAVNMKTDPGKETIIWKKIGEQKPALSNLIELMEDCKEPGLAPTIADLKALQEIFGEIEVTEIQTSETDHKIKATEVKISSATFNKLKAKSIEIRNKIVL